MTPAMIHYLRAALGMTRTQLGQAYLDRVDPERIRMWEDGRCRPAARFHRVLSRMWAAMVEKIEGEMNTARQIEMEIKTNE